MVGPLSGSLPGSFSAPLTGSLSGPSIGSSSVASVGTPIAPPMSYDYRGYSLPGQPGQMAPSGFTRPLYPVYSPYTYPKPVQEMTEIRELPRDFNTELPAELTTGQQTNYSLPSTIQPHLASHLQRSISSTSASSSKSATNFPRSQVDKVRCQCPYKGCSYKGTFMSKDYLRRHIREQHRHSRGHVCLGINPDGSSWGCRKRFNRPYQLVNHWRGQRSLRKCGVPDTELVKYGIVRGDNEEQTAQPTAK
ncbi:DEKNAAC101049 [Brettanomyces naardenensis]|uniref:DEKNAAC101049 n=1 Tax=Brettanomyces naardenensis TaxID=13370 RepID=A0A448YH25_BRENA|nr:DEKNAAC101049 [Brettanomyces naardenensis]